MSEGGRVGGWLCVWFWHWNIAKVADFEEHNKANRPTPLFLQRAVAIVISSRWAVGETHSQLLESRGDEDDEMYSSSNSAALEFLNFYSMSKLREIFRHPDGVAEG